MAARSDDPILSIEQRYQKARHPKQLRSGDIEYELVQEVLGARRVRVSRAEHGEGTFGLPEVEVFLVRQTQADVWVGKLWAKEDNPWLNGSAPRSGDDVRCSVISLVEEVGALVEIDGFGITGLVLKEDLPEGQQARSMRGLVGVGDRLMATVSSVNHDALRVQLDVSAYLLTARSKAERENATAKFVLQPTQTQSYQVNSSEPPLLGYTVAVVDDEEAIANMLSTWLRRCGAKCVTASNAETLDQVLRTSKPSHVILDFDIPGFEALLTICRQTGAKVTVFSGFHEEAQRKARDAGVAFIPKPTDLQNIREWIKSPERFTAKEGVNTEIQIFARVADSSAERFRQEGKALLRRLCNLHNFDAALWVKQTRDDTYDLRVVIGNWDQKALLDLPHKLRHSFIANSITGSAQSLVYGRLSQNDPTFPALKRDPPHSDVAYVAVPIVEAGMEPRVVAFFKRGEIGPDVRNRILSRRDHFQLLINALQQADHVDSIETYATQGRLMALTVHEMRNTYFRLKGAHHEIQEAVAKRDFATIENSADHFGRLLERMKEHLEQGLDNVRAFRPQRIELDKDVGEFVRRLQQMARGIYGKSRIKFLFEPSGSELVVSLPPSIVEQPLFNLVDNALFHMPDKPYSQLRVAINIVPSDASTPIHLLVSDNGHGMTAKQRDTLFEPRQTARGPSGTGLGLFVSREILRAVRGDLELVDSFRWCGTTFRIRLPVVVGTKSK